MSQASIRVTPWPARNKHGVTNGDVLEAVDAERCHLREDASRNEGNQRTPAHSARRQGAKTHQPCRTNHTEQIFASARIKKGLTLLETLAHAARRFGTISLVSAPQHQGRSLLHYLWARGLNSMAVAQTELTW